MGVGSATITARTNDGNLSATCEVMVNPIPDGAVALGLSVLWGTCNLGANSPEEYGDYYAWGEIEPKSEYSWSTYKFGDPVGGGVLTKYVTDSSFGDFDGKMVLDSEDDAAYVKLGGNWRMPTYDEWTELRLQCTWIWTTQNGVVGGLVTGPNGRSIFLPGAGHRAIWEETDSFGNYWSSSIDSGNQNYAFKTFIDSSSIVRYYSSQSRYRGQSIRPVIGN